MLAIASAPITLSGNVNITGNVEKAIVEIRLPGPKGECHRNHAEGELLAKTNTDSYGAFSATVKKVFPYCILVYPSTGTAFNFFPMDSGLSRLNWLDVKNTYLSAISDGSFTVVSPISRMMSERFRLLFSLYNNAGTAYNRSNLEIAEVFFSNNINLERLVPLAAAPMNRNGSIQNKPYMLALFSLAYYAKQLSGTNPSESSYSENLENLWSLYSEDLSDGSADGVIFNGDTTQKLDLKDANGQTLDNGNFKFDLKPYIDAFLNMKGQGFYKTSDYSLIKICPRPGSTGICIQTDCNYGEGKDPYYSYQWHLSNTGQFGGTPGEDIRVEPVWNAGIKGEGVLVAVVDDGLQITHPDLLENVSGGSINFINQSGLEKNNPDIYSPSHGTAIGGVIAARDKNNVGLRGVAPCSNLIGMNLLQNYTLENEVIAMSANTSVGVSNNSWGAEDGTGQLSAANATWKIAIQDGLAYGRAGKGTLYFWASGNGSFRSAEVDNANYDGQANYYGVITVGAIGNNGKKAYYSDEGANLWVVAPSRGASSGTASAAIYTTDLKGTSGFNSGSSSPGDADYTGNFDGTSAAAPVASGLGALLLSVNPSLSWRDVKLILAGTARKNDSSDSAWTTNQAGYSFNPKYGFGAFDSEKAVSLAKTWTSVGGSSTLKIYPSNSYQSLSPSLAIPDFDSTGVSSTNTVSGSNINHIEFIEVIFTATHPEPGQIEVVLQKDGKTSSTLAKYHFCYSSGSSYYRITCSAYSSWVFGTSQFLGESADGTYKLTVKDKESGITGTFDSWGIKIYGR